MGIEGRGGGTNGERIFKKDAEKCLAKVPDHSRSGAMTDAFCTI